jgi:hypothetical protein
MWAPTTGSRPPWTLPTIGEPGVVAGAVGVEVTVVPVAETGASWKAPQPLSRAAARRENARQRLDDRGKVWISRVLQVMQA